MNLSVFRGMAHAVAVTILVGSLTACGLYSSSQPETPVKAASAKKAPSETGPVKAAPAKSPKAKAAPVKAAPAKSPKAKAAPAKSPKAKAVKPYEIKMVLDKKDGIYKTGDTVRFSVEFFRDGKVCAGQKMGYFLYPQQGKKELVMFTTTAKASLFETVLKSPGSLRIEVAALDQDGKILQLEKNNRKFKIAKSAGVIADPETIRTGAVEPVDFQKFWDAARAELAKIPVKAKREKAEVPANLKGKFNCWDVKVDSIGGTPVSGYLTIPANARPKSLPVVVSYHGAGVRSAGKSFSGKAIRFDVNAHGIPNGQKKDFYKKLQRTTLAGYPTRNADDREKFYFRNMYLRVQRALDFVKTLPEWDGKNLIVSGGSQGGAQALVAAGMEPKVTLMYAAVPAMCDHGGVLAGRESGWPRLIRLKKDGNPVNENVVKASGYFDAAFFAKRIKAEAYLTVGLIDSTCVPSSVYAAYNNIPGKKHISPYPFLGHGGTTSPAYNQRLNQVLNAAAATSAPPVKAPVKK